MTNINKDNFFPQYRKLVNDKVYYRIINERKFDEIQLVGTKKILYSFEVAQYPDVLKINDLIHLKNEIYIISTENEWNNLVKEIE